MACVLLLAVGDMVAIVTSEGPSSHFGSWFREMRPQLRPCRVQSPHPVCLRAVGVSSSRAAGLFPNGLHFFFLEESKVIYLRIYFFLILLGIVVNLTRL